MTEARAAKSGRVRPWIAAHKPLFALVCVASAGAVAFVLFLFQPWRLLVNDRVTEAAPTVGDGAQAGPRVVAQGKFRSLEHETRGTAKILELADGSRLLRFEDLATSNGPALVVMLSSTPATEDSWVAYDDGAFVILDELKGNLGDQNYAIAKDVDLGQYKSAVVWCNRFSVGFGAAPLERR